jgi:serine/threonine protein kinase
MYHLGPPTLCTPKLNKETIVALSDCDYIHSSAVKKNINKYQLLISKYGGEDLHHFFKYSLAAFLKTNKQRKIDQILFEVHTLLMGLKTFQKAGLVHNDLKPQNILFNKENCTMKFIDFGLMRKKSTILETSKKSNNWLSIYHWSLPLDCAFMNKEEFLKYKNLSKNDKKIYQTNLAECIIFEKSQNQFNISNPDSFKILFTYLNPSYTIPNEEIQYGLIYSAFQGLNELIQSNTSYDAVLDKITDSIDIFGLGISLQFMINCIHRHHPFQLIDFTNLTSFLSKMYDFNITKRIVDIDALIAEYETILLEMGVLARLRKSFCKHHTQNKNPVPKSIQLASAHTPTKQKLSHELEKNAYLNPISTIHCPDGQERNIRTGDCMTKKYRKQSNHTRSNHTRSNHTRSKKRRIH